MLFAGVLVTLAAALLDQHEAMAALLVAIAVAAVVSSLVIEPATTRAAFRENHTARE